VRVLGPAQVIRPQFAAAIGCVLWCLPCTAVVLVLASALFAAWLQLPDRAAELNVMKLVCVGMTEEDVLARLGLPDERMSGNPTKQERPWIHQTLAYTTREPELRVCLDAEGVVTVIECERADSVRWVGSQGLSP